MTHTARRALLVVTVDGYGKRVPLDSLAPHNRDGERLPLRSRGGMGVVLSTVPVAAVLVLPADASDVVVATASGQVVRVPLADVPFRKRAVQAGGKMSKGVRVVRLEKGDRVAGAALAHVDARAQPEPVEPLGALDLAAGIRAALAMGNQPMVPRAEWAETDVHKASTYSCAHCGRRYEHPDEVYDCIDRHAERVADRALAA